MLDTNTGTCSVTVVSEYLAITAKHCGRVNPELKLNVSSAYESGHDHAVKEILVNRDLDVQALVLRERTGLAVTPLREAVDRDWFYVWGYGYDWSNVARWRLTRADFNLPEVCPPSAPAEDGKLCWQTTAKNSVCKGDSGGPVTQNGAIIGMYTSSDKRDGSDCGTVIRGYALTVQEMQPWLNQMIEYANPFP